MIHKGHPLEMMIELTSEFGGPDCVVSLSLVKLRRHRDDRFLDGYAQLSFSHLPHLQQQPGADELRAHAEGTVGGDEELCTSIIVNHLEDEQRREDVRLQDYRRI